MKIYYDRNEQTSTTINEIYDWLNDIDEKYDYLTNREFDKISHLIDIIEAPTEEEMAGFVMSSTRYSYKELNSIFYFLSNLEVLFGRSITMPKKLIVWSGKCEKLFIPGDTFKEKDRDGYVVKNDTHNSIKVLRCRDGEIAMFYNHTKLHKFKNFKEVLEQSSGILERVRNVRRLH